MAFGFAVSHNYDDYTPFCNILEMETLCTRFRADISVTSHHIVIQYLKK